MPKNKAGRQHRKPRARPEQTHEGHDDDQPEEAVDHRRNAGQQLHAAAQEGAHAAASEPREVHRREQAARHAHDRWRRPSRTGCPRSWGRCRRGRWPGATWCRRGIPADRSSAMAGTPLASRNRQISATAAMERAAAVANRARASALREGHVGGAWARGQPQGCRQLRDLRRLRALRRRRRRRPPAAPAGGSFSRENNMVRLARALGDVGPAGGRAGVDVAHLLSSSGCSTRGLREPQ